MWVPLWTQLIQKRKTFIILRDLVARKNNKLGIWQLFWKYLSHKWTTDTWFSWQNELDHDLNHGIVFLERAHIVHMLLPWNAEPCRWRKFSIYLHEKSSFQFLNAKTGFFVCRYKKCNVELHPSLQKIVEHFYMMVHIPSDDDVNFLGISCILYGFLPI
jgi:hypothetical protein